MYMYACLLSTIVLQNYNTKFSEVYIPLEYGFVLCAIMYEDSEVARPIEGNGTILKCKRTLHKALNLPFFTLSKT